MRIIAGTAKGVRLAPVPRGVRPVSDRVREGMFSSLGAAVERARVLDLYAGTGALGIEALSRGASHVVFVERSRAALATVRANLERTHLADRSTVIPADVRTFIMRYDNSVAPFDVCLLDPPYEVGGPDLDRVLAGLPGMLAREGWTVVLTRGTRSSTPVIPVQWAVARRLGYGDSHVLFFRERVRGGP
jgi:16S rRNA (guanine966-N2)-methyltransferase